MKLTKFFIMFFILTIFFIACKKTTVTVTKPGKNILLSDILDNIEDGTYETNGEKLEITNGGNNIKIGDKNYTNKGDIGGFVRIYGDTNDTSTNSTNMLVMQISGTTITMPATTNGTKALNDAFNYLGEEKATSYISKVLENKEDGGTGSINTDKLLEGVPPEEKKELEKIFKDLEKSDFGSYKIYNKK